MHCIATLVPTSFPTVLRPCGRCGTLKPFAPTDQFRINAQKKLLDIWLIHQCQECGYTWNMEIFARVTPRQLDPALYARLLANDADLLRDYAFDPLLHSRNHVQLCTDELTYTLEGETPAWEELRERTCIELRCAVPLGVRVSKLARAVLGLSASRFEALAESGALSLADGGNAGVHANIKKARMGTACTLVLDPSLRVE